MEAATHYHTLNNIGLTPHSNALPGVIFQKFTLVYLPLFESANIGKKMQIFVLSILRESLRNSIFLVNEFRRRTRHF